MEEMQKQRLSLGGEQSGHLIFSEHLFTGDGLITALNVLRTMAVSGRELADLADDLTTYPQVLLNVRVREKRDLETIPEVAAAMAQVEEASRRQRPAARPVFGHGAASARDARRARTSSKSIDGPNKLPMPSIKLSVNVNKVATLRNSRGGARAGCPRRPSPSASRPAPPASRSIRVPTSATSEIRMSTDRRASEAVARGRVQHRGRSAPRVARARAEGPADAMHARAGEAWRNDEPGRMAA